MDELLLKRARANAKKQEQIEKYMQTRQLKVPKTNVFHILLLWLGLLSAVCLFIFFYAYYCSSTLIKVLSITVFISMMLESYVKFLILQSIKCYQHYAGERTRRKCLCIPSCSVYAIAILKRCELVFAVIKIYKRLFMTCKDGIFKFDLPYKNFPLTEEEKELL